MVKVVEKDFSDYDSAMRMSFESLNKALKKEYFVEGETLIALRIEDDALILYTKIKGVDDVSEL